MPELPLLRVLIAPSGQLSGDGQLRESISERRDRKGQDYPLWHLPCNLVQSFKLSAEGFEAVVAQDPNVITWLQLRFGGEILTVQLELDELRKQANSLPPAAPLAELGLIKYQKCGNEDCLGTCTSN